MYSVHRYPAIKREKSICLPSRPPIPAVETEEEALKGGGSMVSLAQVLRGDMQSQNRPEGEGKVDSGSTTAQGKALLQGAAFLHEPLNAGGSRQEFSIPGLSVSHSLA